MSPLVSCHLPTVVCLIKEYNGQTMPLKTLQFNLILLLSSVSLVKKKGRTAISSNKTITMSQLFWIIILVWHWMSPPPTWRNDLEMLLGPCFIFRSIIFLPVFPQISLTSCVFTVSFISNLLSCMFRDATCGECIYRRSDPLRGWLRLGFGDWRAVSCSAVSAVVGPPCVNTCVDVLGWTFGHHSEMCYVLSLCLFEAVCLIILGITVSWMS